METKKIEIKGATIVSTSGNPAEGEPTTVLVITAPIGPSIADILKCRYLYTAKDQPVPFDGTIKLPLELGEDEAELSLDLPGGGRSTLRPFKIHNFKVSHINDLRMGLEFRSHFKGAADSQIVNDFLQAVNKGEFTCWVGSTQGELFPVETKTDGPHGGKKVDMSPKANGRSTGEPDTGCVSCNNSLPFMAGDDTKHANGVKCAANTEQGTLASAREADGGTHAKRGRKGLAVVDGPSTGAEVTQ